ncbi:MAG: hypothetical protein ABEJ30_03995 [Halorientalis sp.]
MQRRAAAIYFVFFLVIGAGAYGFTANVDAQRPTVSLDAPTYSEGDTLTVDGRTYTVASISAETGPEGEISRSGQLEWTNESAFLTATLENGTTTTYQDRSWIVVVGEGDDPTQFTLTEPLNTSQLLAEDPAVADQTAQYRGEPWVVWADNESLREPLSEYLPEPETVTVSEGDTYPYQGNQTTVREVSTDAVTLAWPGTVTNTVDLSSGQNVTLNGRTYLAYFPDNSTLKLTRDFQDYQSDLARQAYFGTRVDGLTSVAVLSVLAAIVLLGAAYLPVKD